MSVTSLSLLERASESPDSDSWNELLAIYRLLLEHWLRRYHVPDSDSEDLIQVPKPSEHQDADTGRLFQCFRVPDDAKYLTFKLHGGKNREIMI